MDPAIKKVAAVLAAALIVVIGVILVINFAGKDAAQSDEMYEGALAGLSEEEIAKMALAEEESAARTETTGAEDAVD